MEDHEDEDLTEEEFDTKYGDEDPCEIGCEEHLKWCDDLGIDKREYDDRFIQFRRGRTRHDTRYIRRTTLNDPQRIERLRWKAYQNYEAHFDRHKLLKKEIAALGGECFIPHNPVSFAREMKEMEERGDPLSEEDMYRYSQPRRVHIAKCYAADDYVTYGDHFWEYRPPKHGGTDMEVIAAAGALGEWEKITRPDREKRSQDPAKLALGKRYQHEVRRGQQTESRCYELNEILGLSVVLTGLLPKGPTRHQRVVMVHLNGRIYPFKVGQGQNGEPDSTSWPVPSDYDPIHPPAQFKIDDSLVGLTREHIQTRFGQPSEISHPTNKSQAWHYPTGIIRFGDGSGLGSKVLSVETEPAGAETCSLG
jgi:hypothetical protein